MSATTQLRIAVIGPALTAAPRLGKATRRETRVGFRPVSADGLLYRGWLPAPDGIAIASGSGFTGLTMAPFAGKLIADLARGQDTDFDLGPDDPGRAADPGQPVGQQQGCRP